MNSLPLLLPPMARAGAEIGAEMQPEEHRGTGALRAPSKRSAVLRISTQYEALQVNTALYHLPTPCNGITASNALSYFFLFAFFFPFPRLPPLYFTAISPGLRDAACSITMYSPPLACCQEQVQVPRANASYSEDLVHCIFAEQQACRTARQQTKPSLKASHSAQCALPSAHPAVAIA